MNKQTIYWTSKNINDLLLEPPKNLLKDLKESKFLHGEETETYYQCPGYINFFRNMYVVKSAMDLELDYAVDASGNVSITTDKSQEWYDKYVSINKYNADQQMIHLNHYLYFFSEDSIEMQSMPAFFHHTDVSQHDLATGSFDISKWFRPLYPNIILNSGHLSIKKGDALFYLKFDTKKSIDFKHFLLTKEVLDKSNVCLTVKELTSGLKFRQLYSLFAKRNYNKKIIQSIKKSLTGEFREFK
jgi:hypothetical protein